MRFLERWVSGVWFYWLAVWGVRSFVRLAYGLRIDGAERVPRDGGLVVAANHISAWDPPVVGVSVPREVHFMAKKELFASRWMQLLLKGLRAFPVDRSGNDIGAIKSALRQLAAGDAVGIFAQGTRGAAPSEAFDGAAFLAQRAGVPLQPAAIWREGRGFRVRFGEPITTRGRSRGDARAVTAELMARINELLPPETVVDDGDRRQPERV